jgi:hypothetical protein
MRDDDRVDLWDILEGARWSWIHGVNEALESKRDRPTCEALGPNPLARRAAVAEDGLRDYAHSERQRYQTQEASASEPGQFNLVRVLRTQLRLCAQVGGPLFGNPRRYHRCLRELAALEHRSHDKVIEAMLTSITFIAL